jgi:hypothetical protein
MMNAVPPLIPGSLDLQTLQVRSVDSDIVRSADVTATNVTATSAVTGTLSLTKVNVTQLTNITTGVTCSGGSGIITTVAVSIATDATASFTVTNTECVSTSVIHLTVLGFTGLGANGIPNISASAIADGSFVINVTNSGGNTLAGVINIGYTLN